MKIIWAAHLERYVIFTPKHNLALIKSEREKLIN